MMAFLFRNVLKNTCLTLLGVIHMLCPKLRTSASLINTFFAATLSVFVIISLTSVSSTSSQQFSPTHGFIYFPGECSSASQPIKCEHRCVQSGIRENQYFCLCPTDHILNLDGKSCSLANNYTIDTDSPKKNVAQRNIDMEMEIYIDQNKFVPKESDTTANLTTKPASISTTLTGVRNITTQTKSVLRTKRFTPIGEASKERGSGGTLSTRSISSRQCINHRCKNGGVCKLRDGNTYCLCPLGFVGSECEYETAPIAYPEFDIEGGFIQFSPPLFKSLHFRITLEIRPVMSTGMVLYHRALDGNNFLIALDNDAFVFRYVSNNNTLELKHRTTMSRNSPKKWYKVEVERQNDTARLRIDNSEECHAIRKLLAVSSEWRINQLKRDNMVYLGGHPNLEAHFKADSRLFQSVDVSFIGCVKSFLVNAIPVDMRRAAYVGDAISGYGIRNCASSVCLNHACTNNGTCHVTSPSTYSCWCPLGFSGEYCRTRTTVKIPSFGGSSFLRFTGLKGTSKSKSNLYMVFKPVSATGLILYQGYSKDKRGDFLAVGLYNGHVQISFDLGTGPVTLRSRRPVQLGEWSTVRLHREGRLGRMTVNDQEDVLGQCPGSQVQLTLMQDLFVGGHENYDHVSYFMNLHLGFEGCIQTLHLNGQKMDLMNGAHSGVNVANCEGHECAKGVDPCSGAGECVPKGAKFACSCRLGYTETYCQSKIKLEEINRPAFYGNSYLEFRNPRILSKLSQHSFSVAFSVRMSPSHSRGGVLTYLSSDPGLNQKFFLLKVSRELKLHAVASEGGDRDPVVRDFIASIRSGIDNKIVITRHLGVYKLNVNGIPDVGIIDALQGKILLPPVFTTLFLGGVNETTAAKLNLEDGGGIRGCMTDVFIDNLAVRVSQADNGRSVGPCSAIDTL